MRKDAYPDLFAIADPPTRQALKTEADMINAARGELATVRETTDATARTLATLQTEVARLGGVRSLLQTLSTNVNIALDHPWFILGLAADQAIGTGGGGDTILWDRATGLPGEFYDLTANDGLIFLSRKPGLWYVSVHVQWEASAVGRRALTSPGSGWAGGGSTIPPASSGETAQEISGFFPTPEPAGASSPAWSRLLCNAFQDTGGDLDVRGGGAGSYLSQCGCFYLGPLP